MPLKLAGSEVRGDDRFKIAYQWWYCPACEYRTDWIKYNKAEQVKACPKCRNKQKEV